MSVAATGPILVVESDQQLGGEITDQLLVDGYRVQLACSAEHARILAGRSTPALAVLGMLESPRGALGLLEEIRNADQGQAMWDSALPTIVIGAHEQELDMLRAFEAGADDFLCRPAKYVELRARLRAILRRSCSSATPTTLLELGPLTVDLRTHAVSLHGRAVELRPLEFELLVHLARDPERVFSKDELLRTVWGYHAAGSSRTLDSHASRLRRKLDSDGTKHWVVNVWGVGYRLI
jgi:DNA-binding response OmpR family regulator